jgi:hypothetical protein
VNGALPGPVGVMTSTDVLTMMIVLAVGEVTDGTKVGEDKITGEESATAWFISKVIRHTCPVPTHDVWGRGAVSKRV